MANPQQENGHTDIANEIMEKLARYRISGQEYQIIFVVLRQTWGWHKKDDEISLSQFAEKTEMNRSSCVRAIKKLVTKKILSSDNKDTTYAKRYRFNKDYEQWSASIKKDTRGDNKVTTSSDNIDNRGVTIKSHTKENYTKETISKEILFDEFWNLYGKKVNSKKCRDKWQKLSIETRKFILEDIPKRKLGRKWLEGFQEDPMTYLNGERWNDQIEITKQNIKPTSLILN